jgi:hypothetical protein
MSISRGTKFFITALSSIIFSGCGGGGSVAPAPVTSTSAFQLQAANANSFLQTSTASFSISGSYNGVSISGGGTVTRGNATAASFEGRNGFQKVITTTGSFTANGTTIPLTTTGTTYVDSNFFPLGNTGTQYMVVQGAVNIPATARVNDAGNLFTANIYSSSAKTALLGTQAVSFVLAPDTENTALLKIIYVSKDNTNATTSTETTISRVTPAGVVTYISDTVTYPNGSNLIITY